MIFSGKDFQVYHLGSVAVSYPPRSINTQAIQVTAENIGALSLEFKVGLHYSTDGEPYFKIAAEREPFVSGPKRTVELMIFVEDWIVVLWDELYIFQDLEFTNTFQIDSEDRCPTLEALDSKERRYTHGDLEKSLIAHQDKILSSEVQPPENDFGPDGRGTKTVYDK